MQVLPANQGLERAIDVIRGGGIVAHATETCYGFACDLTNPKAVERVFLLKDRPGTQPISALFSSIEEAKKWVEWDEKAQELAEKYLPGPLTIILPLRQHMFPHLSERTLGVRISSFPLAMMLAQKSGTPLSTTSANIHGKPNPYSVPEIVDQFSVREVQPDLILDSGKLPEAPPSTVLQILDGHLKILRQGSVHL